MVALCGLNLQLHLLYKVKKSSIPNFVNSQIPLGKENDLPAKFQKLFKDMTFYCQGLPDDNIL